MKLTKERKIYAGLVVVAACALIGDLVFSGPQQAAANADVAMVAPAATLSAGTCDRFSGQRRLGKYQPDDASLGKASRR